MKEYVEDLDINKWKVGARVASVTLNRYEILAAVCRAAFARAGLPDPGDFRLEMRGFDVPDRLRVDLYDGHPMVVMYDMPVENETVEQKAARRVRGILAETSQSLEGRTGIESVRKEMASENESR